jgi:hypothetical protein
VEKILKIVVVVIVAFLVLKFLSAHGKAGAVASAAAAAQMQSSANGFAPLPAPFIGPADRLLILAPPHCPSQEGHRADELVRQFNQDGIPCIRSGNASIASAREPTDDETSRLNSIMMGPLPIVFINGRVRNNPSIGEIKSEYSLNRR